MDREEEGEEGTPGGGGGREDCSVFSFVVPPAVTAWPGASSSSCIVWLAHASSKSDIENGECASLVFRRRLGVTLHHSSLPSFVGVVLLLFAFCFLFSKAAFLGMGVETRIF